MVMMADLGVRAIGEKPGVIGAIEKEQAADVSRLSIAERQSWDLAISLDGGPNELSVNCEDVAWGQ